MLSLKSRKLLRKIYTGLGLGAVALVFQACYGMPPDMQDNEDVRINGRVLSETMDKPIAGINVSALDFEPCGEEYCAHITRTNKDGYFDFYVPRQESYALEFKDVDGTYNGGLFESKEMEINVSKSSGYYYINSFNVYLKQIE